MVDIPQRDEGDVNLILRARQGRCLRQFDGIAGEKRLLIGAEPVHADRPGVQEEDGQQLRAEQADCEVVVVHVA